MDITAFTPFVKLLFAVLPIALGTYFFFSGKEKLGIAFLLLGAFCLRMVMITLDPFLHDWDERFHALVAKNMMDNPWVPMLRVNPVLPYNYQDWCCNHIWVHKQPLFLWQMALSMKLFGVNEVAMRLPSAIMGTIAVWLVYRTGYLWLKDKAVAYLAALLFALSYYQLEMTSGLMGLDHNDLVYHVYVLASIWAYTEYRNQLHKPLKWLLLIGLFVGCAVLNKWLTGLLVFAGWGTMLLFTPAERTDKKNWLHLLLALAVAVAIFLPWQIYTAQHFPKEMAWSQYHNYLHIIEPLEGHGGDAWYHLRYMLPHYGITLLPFMAVGLIMVFARGWLKRPYTIEMLVMVAIIYLFFSQVKTKMPAFTFAVAPILYMVTAYALVSAYQVAARHAHKLVLISAMIAIMLFAFRPWDIDKNRSINNKERNEKIYNTEVYKEIGQTLEEGYLVFNCKSFEDVEMMFYTDLNAHHWWPNEQVLDSLLNAGHMIAIFKSHGVQVLPPSITNNPRIMIIDKQLH